MKELEDKYRKGGLTSEELSLLKKKIEAATDEDISTILEKRWNEEDYEAIRDYDQRVELLYRDIKRELHNRRVRWAKWVGIAAAFLIPVCLYLTFTSYKEARVQSSQTLVISTGKGEQSSINLPDGTLVKLNELSTLEYSPGRFGLKQRGISFDGEAFFKVARNEDAPFKIEVDRMNVTVLGTTFNLSARKSVSTNILLLLEGKVEVLSSLTGETLILNPNEMVTLDKRTGRMDVKKTNNTESNTSWMRKELVFKKTSLSEVLDILSDKYNIEFSCSKNVDTLDLFTGTLPADDILSCTEILEYAYGVRIKISNGKAVISKNKQSNSK